MLVISWMNGTIYAVTQSLMASIANINLTLSRWRSFAFLNRRLIYPLNTIIKIKLFYWTLKKRGFTIMNISCNERKQEKRTQDQMGVQINNFIPIEILHFIFVSFWISSIKNCNIHVMLLLSSIHTHILPLERLFLPNSCSTRKKLQLSNPNQLHSFFVLNFGKPYIFRLFHGRCGFSNKILAIKTLVAKRRKIWWNFVWVNQQSSMANKS